MAVPSFITTPFKPPIQPLRHAKITPRRPPQMISLPSLATEATAFALLATTTYYLIFREPPPPPPPKQSDTSRGIVGLSFGNSESSPSTTAQLDTAAVPQLDTVGVDINDYLESTDVAGSARLEEELVWATSSLFDLEGCEAVVVVDAAGDVIWAEGGLVGDTEEVGEVVKKLGGVQVVEDGKGFPFLREGVKVAVAVPLGGGCLVVASGMEGFWGGVEERLVGAVCARLAPFVRGR